MARTVGLPLSVIVGFTLATGVLAAPQMSMQPTPAPTTVASTEPWFVNREPLTFAGNLYYPGGTQIHFIAGEMVLSGFYKGIPLYSRTTIEPYSIVFVPLAGGLMQPYERRRSGDLAGTTGSSVPAFPIEIPSAFAPPPPLQAPAPPVVSSRPIVEETSPANTNLAPGNPQPQDVNRNAGQSPQQVGTAGRVGAGLVPPRRRSSAANAIFVEYDHARWFSSAPPRSLPSSSLALIGEWHGFPVYTAARGDRSTIYIPIALGIDAYAAYSKKD